MSGAYPEALQLVNKPSSVPGRSYRNNVNPGNGSVFQPSSTIKIDIPTGGNVFLNNKQSFLKFTVTNASAGALTLPSSAYGMFTRLEIYHGGNLLESINEYGALCNLFIDAQGATGWRTGYGTITAGTATSTAGAQIAAGQSSTFAIPLMSGIIGAHLSKYTPLSFMDADSLRLELTVANLADCVQAANPDWSISNVEFVAEMVELASDSMRMLRQATNGGNVTISSESFRNYNTQVPAGTTAISQLIPAKFSSLKALYVVYRRTADIGATANNPMSRVKPSAGVSTQFRVGSLAMPQKPINGDAEHMSELAKAMHSLSDISVGGAFNNVNYAVVNNVNGKYAIGIELEKFSHATSVIESGISTISQNVYLEQTYTVATVALRMDSYAMFDQFLVVENGVASVKF